MTHRSDAFTPTDAPVDDRPFDTPGRRCSATARRTGERCLKRPIIGGFVCASHGGSAGPVKAAARRRVVEANAAAVVAREGYAPMDSPVEALMDTAAEMVRLKDVLSDQVAQLTEVSLTVRDRTGAENVAAVLGAYERALERVGKILVSMVRLDIANRRVDIEQEKLTLIADAVRRAVWSDTAALEYDQGMRVLDAIAEEMDSLPVAA
jgi:hypothetical protein